MDKLVAQIQGTNINNDTELKQLRALLQKEEGILVKHIPVLDDVLNALDPAVHSLGYTYILSFRILNPKIDPARFLNQGIRLLTVAQNSQIRLIPSKFAAICHKFTQMAIENGQPLRAIKPLRMALVKLRQSSDWLTPVHADLLQCCLITKCYYAAVQTLEEEVFEVNQDVTATTPKDFLLYYYYGGMVFVGLREYSKAFTFFRTACTAPAAMLSAIMVESYKKYVLVSLILHGKIVGLPRYSSSAMQRHAKTGFIPYQELSNAYSTGSTDDVHKVAQGHLDSFQKDKNFGLVKQVIQSLYRRNILKYTQTYITFSLQDLAQGAKIQSVQETEAFLLKMIGNGELFARINQKDGMVSFVEDPEAYDTNSTLTHLDNQIQSAIDLAKKVKSSDESISSSVDYLRKTAAGHERGARGAFSEFEEFVEGADKGPMVGGPGRLM